MSFHSGEWPSGPLLNNLNAELSTVSVHVGILTAKWKALNQNLFISYVLPFMCVFLNTALPIIYSYKVFIIDNLN